MILSAKQIANTSQVQSDHIVILGTPDDAHDLVTFFKNHSDVAFLPWQDVPYARQAIEQSISIVLLIRCSMGFIVGALSGGLMGTRGIINHMAVNVDYRCCGMGRSLVLTFEQELRTRGVLRYFLFVARKNRTAEKFWRHMQLRPTCTEEITYERDLF